MTETIKNSHTELWTIIIEYTVQHTSDYLPFLLSCHHLKHAVEQTDSYLCKNTLNYMNRKSDRLLKLPSPHYMQSVNARKTMKQYLSHAVTCRYPFLFERMCHYGKRFGPQYLELMKYFRWSTTTAQTCRNPHVSSLAKNCELVIRLLRKQERKKSNTKLERISSLVSKYMDYCMTAENGVSIASACVSLLRTKSQFVTPAIGQAALISDSTLPRYITVTEQMLLGAIEQNPSATFRTSQLTSFAFMKKAVSVNPEAVGYMLRHWGETKGTSAAIKLLKVHPELRQHLPPGILSALPPWQIDEDSTDLDDW